MKRFLLLLTVFTLIMLGVGVAFVTIAGSGPQFARRMDASWKVGSISVVRPRMADLDSVSCAAVAVDVGGALPQGDGRASVFLEDVVWQRSRVVSLGSEIAVAESRVRFDRGRVEVRAHHLPGLGWDWGGPERFQQLPARIVGNRLLLDVDLASLPKRETPGAAAGPAADLATFTIMAESPTFERRDDELSFRAGIEVSGWGEGFLEWQRSSEADALTLHLDDVDLTRLPLTELALVFPIPWSPLLPRAQEGRADIDWSHGPAQSQLRLLHYQSRLPVVGLAHDLTFLDGVVTADAQRVSWDLQHGRYSQSKLNANITADLTTQEFSGDFELKNVLGDRGIGLDFDEAWREFLAAMPVVGRCDVLGSVRGFLGIPGRDFLKELRVRFQNLRRGNQQVGNPQVEAGLTGELRFVPQGNHWRVDGETVSCRLAGLTLPACRWQGTVDRDGLHLFRVDGPSPGGQVEVSLDDEGRPEFRVYFEDIDLGAWMGVDLGGARASLSVQGHWDRQRGLSYDGYVTWRSLSLPEQIDWPLRLPHDEVFGQLVFRRYRGQNYFPAITLTDDLVLWVLRGWIDRQSMWQLEGVARFGQYLLPAPAAVPDLIERPREGWQRFEISGPLFDWDVQLLETK